MAGDKIKKDDVLSGLSEAVKTLSGAIGGAITEIEGLIISQKKLAESINIGSSKELKELSQTLDALTKLVKTHNDLLKQKAVADKKQVDILLQQAKVQKSIEDAEIKAQKRKQEALKTLAQEAKTKREQNKLLQDEQKEKERLAKIESKLANEAKKLSSEYAKQSAHLNKIRSEYKDLNTKKQLNHTLTEKEIADLNRLEKEVRELDAVLKKVDADAGQFQRNVGNYTGALSDMTGAIGSVNKELGNMSSGLQDIAAQFKEARASGADFATAMKSGLIGLGLLLAKLGSDFLSQNQGFVDNVNILVSKLKDTLAGGGEGFEELEKATQAWREELRELNLELQELLLNEQDFREISADTTIGINARIAALRKAQEIGGKAAQIEVDIAKKELQLVKDLVAEKEKAALLAQIQGKIAIVNPADAELLNKLNELQLKYNETLDKQADLVRTNAAENRALNVAAAIEEVELLRSKKLSANAKASLLEQELESKRVALDESHKLALEEIDSDKKTLEEKKLRIEEQLKIEDKLFNERRKTSADLLANQNKSTAEEIKRFKEISKIQFDESELLKENDAVRLAEKLKAITQQVNANEGLIDSEGNVITQVGIGAEAIAEIAKIVKIAQENRIENSKRIAEIQKEESQRDKENAKELKKIEEEKIKLQERLLVLENERAQQKKENNIEDLKFAEGENIKRQEKIQEDLLKNENAFNNTLIDERKRLHEETMGFLEAEFIERKKLLELQFQADIAAVDHSSASEEEKDAKKLIIQEKYNQDTKKLEREKTNAITEESKREIEALKEQEKAQFKIITDTAQEITGQLEKVYGEVADKRQEDLDNQIDRRKDNIDKQRELAEKGANTQLAREEALLAKEELLKVEQQRKDEFNKKIIAYWNLLASYAEQNPDTALAKTIKTIGIAEGARALFNADIPSKFDGTEDTGEGGNLDSKGGKLFILHPHERVVTAEQNKLIGDIPNKDLAQLAYNWRTGVLHSEVGQESFGQNLSTSIDMMKYANMIDKKLDKFVQAVQNIEPTHVHLDNLGQVITEKVRNGILKREINVNTKSLR